jgi:hypothetical protein
MQGVTQIYAIFCKDESGITILNKAYKTKSQAYKYAVNKITSLLNIINEDFVNNSENHILPMGAQIIYTLYNMKNGNDISQYEYFNENHIKFFKHIKRHPIMFYVSTLELI